MPPLILKLGMLGQRQELKELAEVLPEQGGKLEALAAKLVSPPHPVALHVSCCRPIELGQALAIMVEDCAPEQDVGACGLEVFACLLMTGALLCLGNGPFESQRPVELDDLNAFELLERLRDKAFVLAPDVVFQMSHGDAESLGVRLREWFTREQPDEVRHDRLLLDLLPVPPDGSEDGEDGESQQALEPQPLIDPLPDFPVDEWSLFLLGAAGLLRLGAGLVSLSHGSVLSVMTSELERSVAMDASSLLPENRRSRSPVPAGPSGRGRLAWRPAQTSGDSLSGRV
ncbi:hypothetical protein [Cystobacter ferrugineus]|uniref:hypothetical protein n=1 Tax=Cystobacter ferrugineus TaxID=83449 RepID=UPI001161458F|nr:hypothetical protein [Cystobacter ferrugineus]